ncbi:hypothetical protein BST63_08280 [Bradyrhizobium canariense]|uniref:Uncharacterized protein n=1 Tax=Bradyrhizobium canariense TaxID=255045 RepID=A0A1X3HCR8_9BRAD|nr:hypothetical protein BSZ21_09575 [Bradyrhizobium canariense]OSI75152.1 hypothetical protein BSZ22_05975 [Bradyrhizobium canariense]OSI81562.1 hypothetical protein BSZ23_06010 [Bradyrhizobium canariense]OSI95199.1 hypothetical protein BSZ25_05005 [Bradyrhizobium canariense]OSI95851.1 hypothetical protein BSZ24_06215 [Bradyrhizobium canariense]
MAGMQFTGRNATWIRIKPFRPDCRDFLTSLRAIQPAAAEPAWIASSQGLLAMTVLRQWRAAAADVVLAFATASNV